MQNNQYDFWFLLNFFANVAQLCDFQMDIQQISNDELMKHLLDQDKVLDEQTNIYLKQILENQKEIINLLKGDKNNAQEVC